MCYGWTRSMLAKQTFCTASSLVVTKGQKRTKPLSLPNSSSFNSATTPQACMLQNVSPPSVFFFSLKLCKLIKTRAHENISHQCCWPTSRWQEAGTTRASPSSDLSFMMLFPMGYCQLHFLVLSEQSSTWAGNTAVGCIFIFYPKKIKLKEQGDFSIAHSILNFWNALLIF